MTHQGYLRYPHIHGDLVTFVAEDDVWLAPLTGGKAWRVSALNLPARNPRFTPDGKRLVWTVTRGSAPEVVTALLDGGDFRQLTHFGHPSTRNKGFLPDGRVLVTSAFQQGDSRLAHGYAVPLDGGAPEALGYGPLENMAFGPALGDEKPVVLASLLSREPAWWKRYRGGTGGKLWIDADGNGEFTRLVPELDGNLTDPVWSGGRIHFLSDHEGYGNLYSVTPDGQNLRRHTDHEDFYVRHASGDGSRLVVESAGRILLLDGEDAEARALDIELGSVRPASKPLDVSAHLREAQPDTQGESSLVVSHGSLHWLRHQEGPARAVEADSSVRARLPRFLADGRVAYLHDRGGEESLLVTSLVSDAFGATPATSAAPSPAEPDAPEDADDDGLPRPVSALGVVGDSAPAAVREHVDAEDRSDGVADASESAEPASEENATGAGADAGTVDFTPPARVVSLEPSPDGEWLLLGTVFGDVILLNTRTGGAESVASPGAGTVDHLAWSPDSTWFAWSQAVAGNSERRFIRLRSRDEGSEVLDVTDGRFVDSHPAFTTDGKFLAFLSSRSFDPVYDGQSFDLSFPHPIRPYLVALDASTAAPFGPRIAESRSAAAKDGSSTKEGAPAQTAPAQTLVDPVGLAERVVPLPVEQGNYEHLTAVPGALLYLDVPVKGELGDGRAKTTDQAPKAPLIRLDLDSGKTRTVAEGVESYRISGDGSTAVVQAEGKLRTVSTGEAEQEPEDLELDRIRVFLEPRKVWAQQYREAWRLQRDFFWDENMGGLDWDAVYERYLPVLERIGSYDDLVDLLWELHGELGTSHAYVRSPEPSEKGSGRQGFLGADLSLGDAGWTVERVLDGDTSDPQAISPLRRPGADVRAGDVLLAVDGVALGGPEGKAPAELLRGAGGRPVELTVRTPGQAARRVAVVPLSSEERLRYQDWVQSKRRMVREASGGGFGYIHIPDMQAHGWAQLHRDLETESLRDALVVDVRRNRGGHTSQLVAELIGRTVDAWMMPRGEYPMVYPRLASRGPVVVLTDEFAGSDGDIITQIVKMRGIGPVIGTRTWGGVVGIDMRFDLVDGTPVSQPRYSHFFGQGIGWGVENRGVDPDIEVLFPPHAHKAGTDPQLEHGIGVLKEMLREIPTKTAPGRDTIPGLVPPTLGPRPGGTS
ncbi:S41 family peptidase [Arthrobacter woluwensis]|uniref:S41 family peptidase n=1 Tax=Arthrobacter woluwensis TaxID=156980 RepID=UPI001AAE73A3|nr:S41 family peptidase [Arthrobacter woluwensis]QTF71271.1 peptidase S41 [Arthrobacter woluwensis]